MTNANLFLHTFCKTNNFSEYKFSGTVVTEDGSSTFENAVVSTAGDFVIFHNECIKSVVNNEEIIHKNLAIQIGQIIKVLT